MQISNQKSHVFVMLIPILGETGVVNLRTLVFASPPTKEGAIKRLLEVYENSRNRPNIAETAGAGWLGCVETLRTIPEEVFARMYMGRVTATSHLCTFKLTDGAEVVRMFSIRCCSVMEVS